MALPPQRIKIKRRRDEEPVETLYIEQKRQRSTYSWYRVESDKYQDESPTTLPKPNSDSVSLEKYHGIPVVHSTLPKESRNKRSPSLLSIPNHQKELRDANGVASEPSTPPNVGRSNHRKASPSKPTLPPRRFHLSRGIFSSMLTHSEPTVRVHKTRKRRNDLAVFVERTKRVPQSEENLPRATEACTDSAVTEDKIREGYGLNNAGPRNVPISRPEGGNERSDTSVADVATSHRNLAMTIDEPSSGYSEESIFLAWQLQELASRESTTPAGPKGFSHHSELKAKLKPPRPRPQKKEIRSADSGGDKVMDDVIDMENDEDFVYDTFVRSSGHVAAMDISEPNLSTPEHLENYRIGILIIEEQDQVEWETFAEEEDSEKEWNSEEEDENAEDFYANDYPEDEIDSDDEFGMGAYNHRNRASDEEEFDEDIDRWSDEEAEAYPWKRNALSLIARGNRYVLK